MTLQATAAAAEGAVTSFNPNDKYIGLALAISSSAAIGTSFIITKKVRRSLWAKRRTVLTFWTRAGTDQRGGFA